MHAPRHPRVEGLNQRALRPPHAPCALFSEASLANRQWSSARRVHDRATAKGAAGKARPALENVGPRGTLHGDRWGKPRASARAAIAVAVMATPRAPPNPYLAAATWGGGGGAR
jgi:hypothetical protein